MELLTYENYYAYVTAQANTQKRKGIGPFFNPREMVRISQWLSTHGISPKRGMCHGARCGMEIIEFRNKIPGLDVEGSDLFPFSGKANKGLPVKITKHDFMLPKQEWIGAFDLIYSNSLDHAYDPHECIRVWLRQLTPTGRLFIQWSFGHKSAGGGDCFAASLDEYISLLMQHCILEDVLPVLYSRSRRCKTCFVLVARKRRRVDRRYFW